MARQRNWGLSLILVGWLHLFAFTLCYCLTIVLRYNDAPGYLLIWIGELACVWLIFRICGGPRSPALPVQPLEMAIRRVWTAYFLLAFNLGSLNTLRGHEMFEYFPTMASLASFAFFMMSIIVDRRFFAAVVTMFVSGLLMAANLPHAYLIFALAWWLELNAIGWMLWSTRRQQSAALLARPAPAHAPSLHFLRHSQHGAAD